MASDKTLAAASRLALTAFGWYCAIDAAIYLTTGVVQHEPFVSNILLNLPHVVISAIMLALVYRGVRNLRPQLRAEAS